MATLPAELPLLGERPFTILLGSCFAHHEDSRRKVGNTFFHLPHAAAPDIKFLAGDQVYLDSPWYRYLIPHTLQELHDAFVEHYTRTWGQTDGFARVLGEGANFFSSDDHEYWNNAPNAGTVWTNTYTAEGRRQWFDAAGELYSAFQTPRYVTGFSVPEDRPQHMDPRIGTVTRSPNEMGMWLVAANHGTWSRDSMAVGALTR
jgi:hypothetical protein